MRNLVLKSAVLIIGIAGMASAQNANDKSADEIKQLFQKQKTRGLVLAPTTPANPEPTSTTATATATTTVVEAPKAVQEIADIPKDLQVNINISFDFDSASLRNDEKPKLEALCEAINSIDIPLFRIVGHTDASGSDTYNEQLSLLRAQEVKRYMVTDCGISALRLEAVGVGERYLYNENNPRGDENRRVEFQAAS